MRTESYNFKEFIRGYRIPTNKNTATVLYSLATPITLGGLLDMSPIMKLGFGIILGVGGLALGAAWYEKKLYKQDENKAEKFAMVCSIALLLACTFGVGYLFLHNPLWRFFQ